MNPTKEQVIENAYQAISRNADGSMKPASVYAAIRHAYLEGQGKTGAVLKAVKPMENALKALGGGLESQEWEGEIVLILADNKWGTGLAEKIILFVRSLLSKALQAREKATLEWVLEEHKKDSKTLPIAIERIGGEYAQGMHSGIDLCINRIIARLASLKKQ